MHPLNALAYAYMTYKDNILCIHKHAHYTHDIHRHAHYICTCSDIIHADRQAHTHAYTGAHYTCTGTHIIHTHAHEIHMHMTYTDKHITHHTHEYKTHDKHFLPLARAPQ